MPIRKKDGIILGAIAGFLAFYPVASQWIVNNVSPLIPSTWLVLGEWSLPVYGALLGALIGVVVESTR